MWSVGGGGGGGGTKCHVVWGVIDQMSVGGGSGWSYHVPGWGVGGGGWTDQVYGGVGVGVGMGEGCGKLTKFQDGGLE